MKNRTTTFLLSILCIFMMANTYGQSTKQSTDKGAFYITGGVGGFPGDMFAKVPYSKFDRYGVLPTCSYTASVKYFVSNNFALSLGGGYYKIHGAYNGIRHVPVTTGFFYVYDMVAYDLRYRYKTWFASAEGSVVYYRAHKSMKVLYGGVGVCVTHTVGYKKLNEFPYQPASTIQYFTCGFGDYPEQTDENRIKAHITVLGLRGGSQKEWYWYAEAGYGFKGLVNAGIGLKL